MMGFQRVTDLALQPSALDLDPEFGRALFLRDIDRTHQGYRTRQADERAAFDKDLAGRELARAKDRSAQPLTFEEKRFRPAGNPNQYMIDALLRENAIAQYDRDAPRLREEQARARTERG